MGKIIKIFIYVRESTWKGSAKSNDGVYFLVEPHGLTEVEGVVLHAEKESKNCKREREREDGENEKIKKKNLMADGWVSENGIVCFAFLI